MDAVVWWVIGFVLVIAEMTTGTFYLLILGTGALLAGCLAYFGLTLEVQSLAATLVSVIGCIGVSKYRAGRRGQANPTQNLDVGNTVRLVAHTDTGLRVHYRGAEWQAELISPASGELPPTLYIHAVRNNCLLVGPEAPPTA